MPCSTQRFATTPALDSLRLACAGPGGHRGPVGCSVGRLSPPSRIGCVFAGKMKERLSGGSGTQDVGGVFRTNVGARLAGSQDLRPLACAQLGSVNTVWLLRKFWKGSCSLQWAKPPLGVPSRLDCPSHTPNSPRNLPAILFTLRSTDVSKLMSFITRDVMTTQLVFLKL